LQDPSTLHGAMWDATGEKNCLACHTEHHGGTASLTSIPMQGFPHRKLGFSLVAHTRQEEGSPIICADCHPDGYATFDCETCHRQMDAAFVSDHVQTFGTDCVACHDGLETLSADFDHAQTQFPLTGLHLNLLCVSCHEDARTLSDLQTTPTACINCHIQDDPHDLRFGNDCSVCHTSAGWSPAEFDHNLARFKLTGEHSGVACEKCHKEGLLAPISTSCESCHLQADPHGAVFGTDCASCHTPNGWDDVTYDHSRTGFILDGAHTALTCEQCHGDIPADQMSSSCAACHAKDDNHGGRFGTDCGACHSTTAWLPATFDHNLSGFPLTGAHASAACESCHKGGQFAGTSSACASCHAEPSYHRGVFGTNCGSCHNTSNWSAKYTGSHPSIDEKNGMNHQGASCRDCHTQTLASATCTKCHDSNNPGDGGGGGD